MDALFNTLLVIIVCGLLVYAALNIRAWKHRREQLNGLQRLLVIDGWWIFRPSLLRPGREKLVLAGRAVFAIVLACVIAVITLNR